MEFKPFKIGKYLLLERLATGGMAEVYRAKASGAGGFEKQLAIKRILPTYSENDEFRRMFEYEARLSSMLTHANIVQVYDFVKSGETYLLAMEYVDGKNLRQFVNKARKASIAFPVEFALFVINEVCKGLEYAHKKKDDLTGKPLNIIHRDMSPQNIMLSYEGAVKIVDFGIAKAKDRADETRSGVIKGKFGYMSPEQANGEPVDHRTDIFSTGIILYELLTGKRLFSAESDMATLRQIQDCVIPQPSRLNPKITTELEKLLLKALAKDINLRFQNAGLLHRALLEFLNKHYPSYTQREVSEMLQKTFGEEIENEKRRFEQLYRQSIPFSQGAQKNPSDELEGVEEALDGEVTHSEADGNTAITFVDEEIPVDDDIESSSPSDQTGEQSRREPTPADPEVSAGGDTKVDSILSDENSMPTQAKSRAKTERTVASGELPTSRKGAGMLRKMEGDAPNPDPEPEPEPEPEPKSPPEPVSEPELEPEPESDPVTKSEPEFEADPESPPVPEPDEREDSITPTQGAGTKSHITKVGATKTSGIGLPEIIRLGQSVPRGPSANDKQGETRVQAPAEGRSKARSNAESSFERKREPRPEPFISRSPPANEFELKSAPGMRERFLGEDDFDEDLSPAPPKRPIFSTSLKLFLMACLIAVGYRTWMEGQVPTLVQMVQPRNPNDTAKPTESADSMLGPRDQKLMGDCTLEIVTDPLGALVSVGQRNIGPTPATVSGACGSAVNVTIQMDLYETISENVMLKRTTNKLYRTLKRVPLGTLALLVNANAKVFLDGVYIGDATANVRFERSLRARRYKIRLINDVLGVETSDTVVITRDAVSQKIERLEPRSARPPASTKPRRPR